MIDYDLFIFLRLLTYIHTYLYGVTLSLTSAAPSSYPIFTLPTHFLVLSRRTAQGRIPASHTGCYP